jgi:hypothetical protein
MPAEGDGLSKRKYGRYVGRCTFQTPSGSERKLNYGRRSKQLPID